MEGGTLGGHARRVGRCAWPVLLLQELDLADSDVHLPLRDYHVRLRLLHRDRMRTGKHPVYM